MADVGVVVLGDVVLVDDTGGACSCHALFVGPCGTLTNSLAQTANFIGVGGDPWLFETRVPLELFVLNQLTRFYVEQGEGCQEACC